MFEKEKRPLGPVQVFQAAAVTPAIVETRLSRRQTTDREKSRDPLSCWCACEPYWGGRGGGGGALAAGAFVEAWLFLIAASDSIAVDPEAVAGPTPLLAAVAAPTPVSGPALVWTTVFGELFRPCSLAGADPLTDVSSRAHPASVSPASAIPRRTFITQYPWWCGDYI